VPIGTSIRIYLYLYSSEGRALVIELGNETLCKAVTVVDRLQSALSGHSSHTMTMTAGDEDYGFPAGYFVVCSTASDRLLDVAGENVRDGGDIILFPEKEKSLVEGVFCSSISIDR
jgi:WD repeat-containing protein 23